MPDDRSSTAAVKGNNPSPKKRKGGKKSGDGEDNASAFIRKYPKLTPKEVSAKGAEHGFDFTAGYVSSIRSKAKGGKKGMKKRGRKGSGGSGGEAEFRKALQGVTLDRAREIIEEVTDAYEGK